MLYNVIYCWKSEFSGFTLATLAILNNTFVLLNICVETMMHFIFSGFEVEKKTAFI